MNREKTEILSDIAALERRWNSEAYRHSYQHWLAEIAGQGPPVSEEDCVAHSENCDRMEAQLMSLKTEIWALDSLPNLRN